MNAGKSSALVGILLLNALIVAPGINNVIPILEQSETILCRHLGELYKDISHETLDGIVS